MVAQQAALRGQCGWCQLCLTLHQVQTTIPIILMAPSPALLSRLRHCQSLFALNRVTDFPHKLQLHIT